MKQENEPSKKPVPTRSELEILQVLWQKGPSTVRVVNEVLNKLKRSVQYTSTLKLMQIMVEKQMLTRDETSMKHIYHAAIGEQETKSDLLEKFVDSMYNGSASSLMVQLLGNKKTSKKELQAIRDFLDQMDKGNKS